MTKLKASLLAKILAIVLLAASCLALVGALFGVLWLDSEGAYRGDAASVRGRLIEQELQNGSYDLLSQMQIWPVSNAYGESIRFELLDENGEVLAGSLRADDAVQRQTTRDVRHYNGGLYFTGEDKPLTAAYSVELPVQTAAPRAVDEPAPLPTPTPKPESTPAPQEAAPSVPEGTQVCTLRLYWTEASASASVGAELSAFELLYPLRYVLIGAAVGGFVLAVLLFVFLMAAAGHRDKTGEVKAGFVEKIPFDLLLALCLAGIYVCLAAINASYGGGTLIGSLLIAAVCLLAAGLLALLCLMSLAVRLKLGVFLESCLVWRVLRRLWKGVKAVFAACGKLLRGVPLVWKWIPPFLLLLFIDFAYTINNRRNAELLVFGFLLKALLLAALCLYLALALRRLRRGAAALAAGDERAAVDTKYLVGDLKAQAEDLNHIRDGLSRAVDARMKSERLRTELITNVSHDIKTPLTSIVNYVDLLSKEELPEKAAEYLEVLQRQSARLKKLTEDLVEASKASTGNLPVNLERLELGVLLDQAAGEYGERLAEKQLTLLTNKPAEPVFVRADPRHLWRMLDNLMSNILKYALPGTRVYLDLTREGGRAALCFRNISAAPLNVRPEELTERFVRGDAARSSEGSGLGLAIAASLAKLQNIELDLAVDGDLFKVTLRFGNAEQA